MSLEDPRHYLAIKPVPPWEMAKDAKLKARSFDQYNLGSPTRLDMFRMNYTRRLRQMTSQGFMSSQSKPYQPVGTLVLSAKELVKKTLGQEKTGNIQIDVNEKTPTPVTTLPSSRSSSAAKREMRRRPATASVVDSVRSARQAQQSQKHLQDIATNLNVVENTKYSVKMGHPLFEVLETLKTTDAEAQHKIQLQISGDEKENILGETMSLTLMSHETETLDKSKDGVHTLPVPKSFFKLTSTYTDGDDDDVMKDVDNNGMQMESRKAHMSDELPKIYWLWRQLCALHWLIEACRHEHGRDAVGQQLIPITECWNVVKPGGRKINMMNQDRFTGLKWRQFSNPNFSTSVSASRSTSACSDNMSLINRLHLPNSPRRTKDLLSIFKRQRSPSPSIVSTIETPKANKNENAHDYDDPTEYHKNLVKLLDTVKESVCKEMLFRERVAEDNADKKGKLCIPVYKWAYTLYTKKAPVAKKMRDDEDMKSPDLLKKNVIKIRPHTAGPTMGQNSFRHTDTPLIQKTSSPQHISRTIKRPRSSPPKLALQFNTANFQSSTREQTVIRMKEQFEEITSLKALRLHQSFTELQRSRGERMEKKFEAFQVKQRGMHKDLKVMRSAGSSDKTKERSGSRLASPATAALTCQWYNKLLAMTLVNTCKDKPCLTVLRCLEESAAECTGWQTPERAVHAKRSKSYAPVDNQVTVESFVAVLRQLRPFEIHSPDVSAAIEFTRENIVKMPMNQFNDVLSKLE